MIRADRKRVIPQAIELLEARWLLAAPEILGNAGQVVVSQFQPFGFRTTVGTQLLDVTLRGKISINVKTPLQVGSTTGVASTALANTGLISNSQFNGAGFLTVGVQFDGVTLGGGLTVEGTDNDVPVTTNTAASPGASVGRRFEPIVLNSNLIDHSQFNDGGFGILEKTLDGKVVGREGRVGLQWQKTRVAGPVYVHLDDEIIRPGVTTPATVTPALKAAETVALGDIGTTEIDPTTNSGQLIGAQFNDGGFGDIGFQWSEVKVGGSVGTSTNTLFINPIVDDGAPITVADRVFDEDATTSSGTTVAAAATPSSVSPVSLITPQAEVVRTTFDNSATNSGKIVKGQFNDGGFGDVGLQWKKVAVGGNVTAVHNSLTVQPENHGQGFISVRNVKFPATPKVAPQPNPEPLHKLADDPAVVPIDGDPVTTLHPPTGPISPFFPIPFLTGSTITLPHPGNFPLVNSATNSGLIRGGQFASGGFGDDGLQWQNVKVSGGVKVVHNSLSVHPEGTGLKGISVADVAYGKPVSKQVARHLAVLPFAVISPGDLTSESTSVAPPARGLTPRNNRFLINQQVAPIGGSDVFLQWNGIVHNRGLVLVHNIIKISGVGVNTGPITLQNIRFPFKVPPLGPLQTSALMPTVTVGEDPTRGLLLNTANNSGILSHAQFADGGFGDDGMQWRNVRVQGSVDVVHNTLAVDASADPSTTDTAGPIIVSNVTFNSGALEGSLSPKTTEVIVSPPDKFQRVSSHPVNPGKALKGDPRVTDETTNSGIMAGGQLAGATANHTLLQWQCVRVKGKVRVIDNILSISVLDRPSRPITISDITFA